ncbi:hypothetical protein [Microbacterium sp. LWH3-1.2]|uniref:hypothetical protein n=1 Tax=Microbacterium sp. LWH3-1.2 TaxID=3135256 RepID=UPI00343FBB00
MPESIQPEESDEDFAARAEALRTSIRNHPGRIAHNRWDSVRLVHAALKWNEHFLLRHIDFTGPEGEARAFSYMGMEREQREAMQTFWMFLFLFLANYTAMNTTLVDNVRGLMANYRSTPFAQEEEKRRQSLGYAPVTQFLKDLRNYITHVTTPPLSFEMSFQNNETKFVAKMKSEPLLASGRFSATAKQYIGDQEDIVIADAVTEYAGLREAYYTWMFEQFDALHGDDIRAHDELVNQQNAMYGLPAQSPAPDDSSPV